MFTLSASFANFAKHAERDIYQQKSRFVPIFMGTDKNTKRG
jgi:hypothetical protein